MTRPDNKPPRCANTRGRGTRRYVLMQNERSTRRRVRIAANLYQRPSDGKFEIGFADMAGRWRIKTLRAQTRTDAKAERDEFLSQLRRGQIVAPSKVTFGQAAAEYLAGLDASVAAGERAPRTAERYRQHLESHVLPALGAVPLQRLTPDQIAAFLRDRQAIGLASWTRKGMLTPMGRVFALAVRRGYISDNPLRRLESEELPKGKAKDQPRVLDGDEISRLLAATSSVYRPILATKVFSGLRVMELLGLCWRSSTSRKE